MVLSRVILSFMVSGSLFLGGFSAPARAEEALVPLPALTQGFDLTGYAAGTSQVKKTIDGVPSAGFEVTLPNTWAERTTLGQTYGELVRYEGPAYGDVQPFFSLKRILLKRENTARLELVSYILKQGYVLRAINEIDERNVEALYVLLNDRGDSFHVRARLRFNGSDFLLAEYGVPSLAWEQHRDEQTFSMQAFKFLNDDNGTIEPRTERTYFKYLRFYYPASWVFEGEDIGGDNKVSVRLANKGDTGFQAGRIRFTLVASRSLKDEKNKSVFAVDVPALLKETRALYENSNFVFGKKIESKKPDLNLPVSFAVEDAYELHQKRSNFDTAKLGPVTHELWLSVFKTVDAAGIEKTYLVELFTPARAQDIYLWSINTRAFEIVLKSVQ